MAGAAVVLLAQYAVCGTLLAKVNPHSNNFGGFSYILCFVAGLVLISNKTGKYV